MVAAQEGHEAIVRLLIERKASINVMDMVQRDRACPLILSLSCAVSVGLCSEEASKSISAYTPVYAASNCG